MANSYRHKKAGKFKRNLEKDGLDKIDYLNHLSEDEKRKYGEFPNTHHSPDKRKYLSYMKKYNRKKKLREIIKNLDL